MPRFLLVLACLLTTTRSVEAQFSRDFGVGYNSATGALMGNCVSYDRPASPIVPKTMAYTLEYLKTVEDLRRSLGISAHVSVTGAWGNVDAKTDFFRSVHLNTYSLFMLIKGELKSDFVSLSNPRMREEAITSAIENRRLTPAEFFAQCGDEYIAALRYGGAIYGLLVINTSSLSEKEQLAARLTGGAAKIGFTADASVQQTFARLLETTNYHIEYFQEGGSVASVPEGFKTLSEFFAYAKSVEKTIFENPAVLDIERKSYRTVDGTLDTRPNHTQRAALRDLAKVEERLIQRIADLQEVAAEPWRFVDVDAAAVKQQLLQLTDANDAVATLGSDCYRDADLCDKSAVDKLRNQWSQVPTAPSPSPIYRSMAFSTYRETPRYVRRNTGCAGRSDAYEYFNFTMKLGELRVIDKRSIRYNFTCEKSGYVYNCGGGEDTQYAGRVESWRGNVTADVAVKDGVMQITNVKPDCACEEECYRELLNWIKSKHGMPALQ